MKVPKENIENMILTLCVSISPELKITEETKMWNQAV